jgi:hypothetical protein
LTAPNSINERQAIQTGLEFLVERFVGRMTSGDDRHCSCLQNHPFITGGKPIAEVVVRVS